MLKYKKYLSLLLSVMLLALIIIPQHKGSALLIEINANKDNVVYDEKLNMNLTVSLSNINNAFDVIPANSIFKIIIEDSGGQKIGEEELYLNGTSKSDSEILNVNSNIQSEVYLFNWYDIGYNDTLKNHKQLANYLKYKYNMPENANITKSERSIVITSDVISIRIILNNDREAYVKINNNDTAIEKFKVEPSSRDVYAIPPNKFKNILITDYDLLFKWNEIRNGNARELPEKLINFIDERLNEVRVNSDSFNLFKNRWKNDTRVNVDHLQIRITADTLQNGTAQVSNNISIELKKINNNKVNFTIRHSLTTLDTYELLIKDEKVYQAHQFDYQYNSYINAYYSPMILNYTAEIDTSRLDPGRYKVYAMLDTGSKVINSIEPMEFTVDVPDILKGFEYIKRLEIGKNDVKYKDLSVTLNITKRMLIGIREITSIDISNYNLFSKVFEVRVSDPNKINGKYNISLSHIITNQDIKLLRYENGTFEEGNNIRKVNNTLSAEFDDLGIFLIAAKKEQNNNEDERGDRGVREDRFERDSTFVTNTYNSFPILIRTEKESNTFSIDLTRYGISVNKLILHLNKPTNTLYLKLTIPDKQPLNKFDGMIISHFQFDDVNNLDKAEIIFTVDRSFTNANLYQLINNNWILQETVKDDIYYKAVTNSLTSFVITASKNEVTISKDNNEREQLFPLPRDTVTNINDKYEYNFNFNLYGHYLKISMDGIIHSIDTKSEENSIIIKVSKINSKMIITLPREIIDAKKADGMDARFIVLVDGKLINYSEDKNNDYRILSIELPKDAKEIQIVGSKVVPEFNTIAIILIISISIAIFSKKMLYNH